MQMREYEFRKWLIDAKEYGHSTADSRVSNVLRVCRYETDLDILYERDKCRDLLEKLTYSELDRIWKKSPKHNIPITGDIYNGTATLKQAVKLYIEFRDSTNKTQSPTKTPIVFDADFVIKEGVLIRYRGHADIIRIPSSVKKIGDQVFSRNKQIKELYIPEGVEAIGEFAFSECVFLTDVRLPHTLKKFTYNIFLGCSNINKVTMPLRLQNYGAKIFSSAYKVLYTYEKTVPDVIQESGERAAGKKTEPKGATLISDDFTIVNGVLQKYKGNDKEVVIPENVREIGRNAFTGTNIQKVTLPDSVLIIQNWAFSACSKLEQVVLVGGLKTIGSYAFNGCVKLSQINLTESIDSIGLRAFHDCESLPNNVLPNKFIAQGSEIFGEPFASRKTKAEKEEELRQKKILEEKLKKEEEERREKERVEQEKLWKKQVTKIKERETKNTAAGASVPTTKSELPSRNNLIQENTKEVSLPVVPVVVQSRTVDESISLTQDNWDKFVLEALNGNKNFLTDFVTVAFGKECVIDPLFLEYLQPLVDGISNRVDVQNEKIEFKKDAKGAKAFEEELVKFDKTQNDIEADIANVRSSLAVLEEDTSWMDLEQWISHYKDIARNDERRKRIKQLEYIAWQPYYARIDVRSGDYGREPFYIGEKEYSYNDTEIVSVWSEFGKHYRNRRETSFSVRGIEYQILLRRKFDITGGKLVDMSDEYDVTSDASEMNITDPFLLVILQRKKTEKQLSNIISSIQHKQNKIIEYDFRKNLIVQGCAGSGKTMILLHRLANIKYNSPEYDFNKVKIITPNENFNLFIDDLTANLGIEDISKMSLGQYYAYLLACYHKEKLNGLEEKARDIQKRENLKKKDEFALPFEICEKIYGKTFYSTVKERIDELILDDLAKEEEKKRELQKKLEEEKPYLSNKEVIRRAEEIRDFKILRDLDYFLGEGEEGSKNYARGYVHRLLNDVISKEIDWNVNYNCVLYAKLLVVFFYYGALTNYRDRLLCIDEAQDIALSHFELLKSVHNNTARFNLYGDLNQRLQDNINLLSWESLKGIIDAGYFALNENYRNAKRIVEFYNEVLHFSDDSFGISSRKVTELKSSQIETILLLSTILDNRTALIASNEDLLQQYCNKYTVLGAVEKGKISLLTVRQAKGLEFDTVVVLDNGMNTNERYISYSRALSELFYVSEAITKTEEVIFESSTEKNSDNLTEEIIIKDTGGAESVSKSGFSKKEIYQKLCKAIKKRSNRVKYEKDFLLELLKAILGKYPEEFICDEREYERLEKFFLQEYLEYAYTEIYEILKNE